MRDSLRFSRKFEGDARGAWFAVVPPTRSNDMMAKYRFGVMRLQSPFAKRAIHAKAASLTAGVLAALVVPSQAFAQAQSFETRASTPRVAKAREHVHAADAEAGGAGSQVGTETQGKALTVRSGALTCEVVEYDATPAHEARAAGEILCEELANAKVRNQRYMVRIARIEGHVFVTVTGDEDGQARRMTLAGLSEISVAAPRFAKALAENRSIAATAAVDNLTNAEAASPRVRNGRTGLELTLIAGSAVGKSVGVSGGVGIGLVHHLDRVAVQLNVRTGGVLKSKSKLEFTSLDVGGRYYFGVANTAPFVGGGAVIGTYDVEVRDQGIGGFTEVGIGAMRNSSVGVFASLRADLPFFSLKTSGYAVPLMFNVGVAFQ